MKVITLQPEQFESFAKEHKYRSYYQTTKYGLTMAKFGFNVHYLGFLDDNERLFGASLVLYKEIFMNHKYAYAPRGFLLDYQDKDLLKALADRLKKLFVKQNFMYMKIDPFIPCAIRDKKGEVINYNPQINETLEALRDAGFVHHGFTTEFYETEKSRFEAVTTLQEDTAQMYKKLDKQTRNKIQKAIKSGIEIIKDEQHDFKTFYDLVKRKYNRPIEYYQDLAHNFNQGEEENFEIYFAMLNTETFVINSKRFYEEELDVNDELAKAIQDPNQKGFKIRKLINKKMESDRLINTYKNNLVLATKLLQDFPEGLIIGTAAILKYEQSVNLLIEGFDQRYKQLNSNYLLKWKLMEHFGKLQYKYFNLNAVSGEFNNVTKYSGLNEMKLGFNSVVTEYIGEFDLILNPIVYNLYKGVKNKEKV